MAQSGTNQHQSRIAIREWAHHPCPAADLPGRIVPVPRSITADCGMAWRCEPSLRGQVEALVDPNEVMGIYELEI